MHHPLPLKGIYSYKTPLPAPSKRHSSIRRVQVGPSSTLKKRLAQSPGESIWLRQARANL